METFTKQLQLQKVKGLFAPAETALDKDIREINELEDVYFNLMSPKEAEDIGLYRDINGNLHNINNIPDGTVFDELDLSGMDFTELPDLSKCVIKKLIIRDCKNLTSLKNLPNYIKEIDCSGCSSLTSLEGCPKGVKRINCTCCHHLIYIPDYIPDDAIEGISEGGIIQFKSNWIGKNKETILDTAKEQTLSKEGLASKLRHTLKSKGPKAAFNLFKKINGRGKESSVVLEINTPFPSKEGKKKSIKDILSLRKKSNRDG